MRGDEPPKPAAGRAGFAAILGWTNVGKSTLLNRLVGQKIAAVADAPQTTRNRITGVLTLGARGQIVFLDTPGFHVPEHRMNRLMVDTAKRTLAGVDVALFVVDAERGLGAGDSSAAARLRRAEVRRLAVLNKIDRVHPKSRLLPMMRVLVDEWRFEEAFPVSARTGEGCGEVVERVLSLLPEAPPPFPEDYLTDQPERQIVAEWIREALARHTRQEIPHATAVVVERWHERADGLVEIGASILVERDSQKAIVIGKGGAKLKAVGTDARGEIEALLGARVFLEIHVSTRPDWRNDERTLSDLGLE